MKALKGDTKVCWKRLSAGAGSQEPRPYEWTGLAVNPALFEGWQRAVLIRRRFGRRSAGERVFVFAPDGTTQVDLALAVGVRWNN